MVFESSDLVKKHDRLVHSNNMKVVSHVQRNDGDWIINTLIIDGYDVPFRYRRKQKYRSLVGARVNLTYYVLDEVVGGLPLETMKVVRIRVS